MGWTATTRSWSSHTPPKMRLTKMRLRKLALGGGVGGPEHREVLEHLAGLIEVRGWLGRKRVKLRVDRVAVRDVLGAL